jgi:hypothetical protein
VTDLEELDTMDLEANREKSEVVVEHQEVPNEEAMVETIRAQKDRYWDWYLAAGRHQQPKK